MDNIAGSLVTVGLGKGGHRPHFTQALVAQFPFFPFGNKVPCMDEGLLGDSSFADCELLFADPLLPFSVPFHARAFRLTTGSEAHATQVDSHFHLISVSRFPG